MTILILVGALLAGGAGAYWLLRRESGSHTPSVFRLLLVAVLLVATLGFGACGGWGSFMSIQGFLSTEPYGRGFAPLFLGAGLAGLLIAFGLAWLIRRLCRSRGQPGITTSTTEREAA